MPKCGQKTEVYSRVCGYCRPVSSWNLGKRAEFADRKNYLAPAMPAQQKAPANDADLVARSIAQGLAGVLGLVAVVGGEAGLIRLVGCLRSGLTRIL